MAMLTCECADCDCCAQATVIDRETGASVCAACAEYATDVEGVTYCSRCPEYTDEGEWTGGGSFGVPAGWVSHPAVRRVS
jgi:hypothetical protein